MLSVGKHRGVNANKMAGILKLTCGVQVMVNDMAVDVFNNQQIDINSLRVTEGLINRLKHEICQVKDYLE